MAALTKPSQQKHIVSFFTDLCILLPCTHCRRSYNEFFSLSDLSQHVVNEESINYVFKIHSLVDDKLERQRMDRFFEKVSIEPDVKERLRMNSILLSSRPTLQVVMKRWELCEDKPFADAAVWRILFAFVMMVDTEEDGGENRRRSILSWISALASILENATEYEALAKKLKSLESIMPTFPYSTRQGFFTIAMVRECLLHVQPSENDLAKIKESERSWLKPLWSIYKHNLPAGSCGRFTCN